MCVCGGGGVDVPNIPKDIVAGPFYCTEQSDYLKISTGCVWKMNELERRAACPPISCYSSKGRQTLAL